MHKNRRITLHQKIGKGIKFNYITSKNAFKNVSGIQNVIIYVGTVHNEGHFILQMAVVAAGLCLLFFEEVTVLKDSKEQEIVLKSLSSSHLLSYCCRHGSY